MIKVTLLGDSIRLIGYGTKVPELLGEEFEVFQPSDNCRYCKYTLRGLHDWKSDMEGSQIVHWNNGLWDNCNLIEDGIFTTEEEYVATMVRIASVLQKRYGKVIFATTTPVKPENEFNQNETIVRYNAILVPKLREMGVIINDLHSLVASDIDRYVGEDTVHLSEEGILACAQQVCDVIRTAAKELE